MVFGLVLDGTNPVAAGPVRYLTWGWAFSVFGFGGLGAAWTANALKKRQVSGRKEDV